MSQQKSLFLTQPDAWKLDDESDWVAARVVFAKSPFGPYDYFVPRELRQSALPGRRVTVPLGKGNRNVEGYCVELVLSHSENAQQIAPHRLKPIHSVVDADDLISPSILDLARWISYRWHCPLGVTLETVVPAGVRSRSNTRETLFLSSKKRAVSDAGSLPPKQRRALQLLAESDTALTPIELAQQVPCTLGPIHALRKKGLVLESTKRVETQSHALARPSRHDNLVLNRDQAVALDQIVQSLFSGGHQTVLLHGVTDSGKTEVYIRAIQEVIGFGRQAIVLVPEISLTPQTRQRFCERFDAVAVLHSNLTTAERAWHWRQIAGGKVQVVIGARSAVFAPVPHLGLIVLDEEHDSSFKQDSSPRYHARDVARQRTKQLEVPLVLGSATPSLESWHLANEGEYLRLSLPTRIEDRPLPVVRTIDLRGEFARKRSGSVISRPLHSAMHESLSGGGQVILLLNRRGYATSVQCPQCGHVMCCPDCAIALTHHRDRGFIMCHYCDHRQAEPKQCAKCGGYNIQFWGTGTQRLEQEVQARFPNVSCIRMDTDSMQRPGSHEAALSAFRRGEKQILVGTQMIAKGLDFPNVTLVGVINADTALHLHDFRAGERTFALVTQVAGRTGRGPKGGQVLVQTFNPEHPSIMAASRHDYPAFASLELEHRSEFQYPPFGSLARVVVRSAEEPLARAAAEQMASDARTSNPDADRCKVIGPAEAPLSKLRGKFRFHFLLKAVDEALLHPWISSVQEQASQVDDVQCIVDVDPGDML